MNVYEFLHHFKDDIHEIISTPSIIYEESQYRLADFLVKTRPFQDSSKKSYFDFTFKFIEEVNFNECLKLSIFLHFGGFNKNDILQFNILINNFIEKLSIINNQYVMEDALSFIHNTLDFLFHAGLLIDMSVLNDLKKTLELVSQYDPLNFREMPLRFIEYFQNWKVN
jgi:hypothetical protein